MLKILQARLQQYMNRDLPNVQARCREGRGTRDQIANIRWITEKAREFQKNIYFCFSDYTKSLTAQVPYTQCTMKQQIEPGMEKWTGSKLGKEYIKAVFCHPAYLIYMQVHHVKCWAG